LPPRLHDRVVHDAHGLGLEDEVRHAVVARGVESHLEVLVHDAVQALDLLASAFLTALTSSSSGVPGFWWGRTRKG